jgi:hypothetical protein
VALNFPNSPTIGQVYTDTTSGFSYEWDGTVWKSYSPASASNIKILDDISGSFNGSTQTFALASGGVSVLPANAQSLIITLGGVTQEPGVDYTVSTTNITFTTAPEAALTFSGISLGPAVPITYANDGVIYIRNTYTGAGTTGPFSFPEGYAIGYLDVYRNGVRLSSGTDFVGTSGTNFYLTDAAAVSDEIEAIGYTITSIINASTSFDNINVTGITTTKNLNVTGVGTLATLNVSGNATFSGIATHNSNLVVGVGYSLGIGTIAPVYHLTVTEDGASPTPSLSYCIADFSNNINGYSQVNIRNVNTGTNASGDLVITADNGTDTTNFIDLGINNTSFNNPTWTVNGALDGYLYSSNQNFSIGVAFPNRYLSFFAGGTLAANEKMRVNDTGVGIGTTAVTTALTVVGVVSATSFTGNGANLTGLNIPAGYTELDGMLFG